MTLTLDQSCLEVAAISACPDSSSSLQSPCRDINAVEADADILLDLARLRHNQGHRKEALRHAEEALLITERSEYVLQGADVHLFLAEMALEDGDTAKALEHARQARALATCDSPPTTPTKSPTKKPPPSWPNSANPPNL